MTISAFFYIVGKMGFFQNDVYTGFQSGMEKGEKSKPKATGSPGSCMRGIRFRKAFSGECGIGGKPLIPSAGSWQDLRLLR